MGFLGDVLRETLDFFRGSGADLTSALIRTVWIAISATFGAVVLGVPLGVILGRTRFVGRTLVMTLVNTAMALPPVLVGLVLLLLIWPAGPLGGLNILFTPAAMVIAQVVLATPIVIGLTAAAVGSLPAPAVEFVSSLQLNAVTRFRVYVMEAWPQILAAVATGFGRVIAEVGAVLLVGGNIVGETRVLTTAIVQETRQARFGAALALGGVLLVVALFTNGVLTWLQVKGERDG